MTNKIFGWHFVGATLRDGSPIPADNRWLKHTGELKMCESGLHWSPTPWEALQYAPGGTLCRVELRGRTMRKTDKAVSMQRCIRQRQDITDLLWQFARQQALLVINLWDAPDLVRQYLETGNESLRAAARAAAWSAAWADSWAAAKAAARSAAKAAAGDAWAAGNAAGNAARAAAGAAWAAGNAAGAAFNSMVYEAFGLDERGKL